MKKGRSVGGPFLLSASRERRRGLGQLSIVEVLGPHDTSLLTKEISVQNDTLELADVNDEEGIARHVEASQRGSGPVH